MVFSLKYNTEYLLFVFLIPKKLKFIIKYQSMKNKNVILCINFKGRIQFKGEIDTF